jgi:hypothetical protein
MSDAEPTLASPIARRRSGARKKLLELCHDTIPLRPKYIDEVKNHISGSFACSFYKTVDERAQYRLNVDESGRIGGQRLTLITDSSGHYLPRIRATYLFLKHLHSQKVSLGEVRLSLFKLNRQINAQAFFEKMTQIFGHTPHKTLEDETIIEKALSSLPAFEAESLFNDPRLSMTRIAVQGPDQLLYGEIDRRNGICHSGFTSGGRVRWAGELVTAERIANPKDLDMLKAFGLI